MVFKTQRTQLCLASSTARLHTPKAQPTHSEMKLTLEMQMTHRGLRDSGSWQVKWDFEGHLEASCIQPGKPPGVAVGAKGEPDS